MSMAHLVQRFDVQQTECCWISSINTGCLLNCPLLLSLLVLFFSAYVDLIHGLGLSVSKGLLRVKNSDNQTGLSLSFL